MASTIVRSESAPAPFPSWRAAGLRYYKYSWFLRERFGERVRRVAVDGGFTCPNVDGSVVTGGCVYCDNESFNPARRSARKPIAHQVSAGIEILNERFAPSETFLAYFQAGTNTYAPSAKLRRLYDEALADPRVAGLIVGTRPDCVPDDVLDLLADYSERTFVAVELGLQSVRQASLDWMNRGHDVACFFDAVARARRRAPTIDLSAHVIFGLPGESRDDMLASIAAVADSGLDGVKIHNLHVVRETPLALQYARGDVRLLEADEHLELLIAAFARLPANVVIHRAIGDAPTNYLVAPQWVSQKAEFLQRLDRELETRDVWQGKGP